MTLVILTWTFISYQMKNLQLAIKSFRARLQHFYVLFNALLQRDFNRIDIPLDFFRFTIILIVAFILVFRKYNTDRS